MSEHLGKSAEMVVTASSDVRNEQPQRAQKAAKPNPARWVLQNDGGFRWWGGYDWTNHFSPDQTAPDPTLTVAPALPIEAAAPATIQAPTDMMAQLKQLGELRDAGILTEEEFAAKKTEILGRI